MTKKEIAYENIIKAIYTRELPPGTKIVIRTLAERYKMSEIPIREALTMLENDKLVVSIPYVGFMVSTVDFDEFIETSLIRNELECLALRISITYLTEQKFQEILNIQNKLHELYEAHNIDEYVITNRRFYEVIISASPCEKLQHTIETMNRHAALRRSILVLLPQRIEPSLQEHEQLIEAIRNRDVDKAAHTMFAHRLNSLLTLTHEIKESLMAPDYSERPLLQAFFSEEDLRDRGRQIGKIELWNHVLENILSGYDAVGLRLYPLN